ncbi:MAG: hypothetical protein R8J94_21740 [Acidimicrobiia bacterium]|nr:hypothetical protein [Acidimicrobiia bacterium]
MTSLVELRVEYEREHFGALLYDLSSRVVTNGLRGKPPSIYQPTGPEDVLHGFIETVLLGQNQLEYFFTVATDVQHFERLCYRQLRRYLASTRVQTDVDRLMKRSVKILRDDDRFESIDGPPDRFFMSSGSSLPFAPGRWRAAATLALNGVPRIFSEPKQRSPKIYTDDNLGILLSIVLRELEGSVSRSDLAKLFEEILTPWLTTVLEEDEAARLPSHKPTGEEDAIVSEALEAILPLLDEEAAFVFRHWYAKTKDDYVADRLGVSRTTVINRRNAVGSALQPHLEGLPVHLQEATLRSLFLATGGSP